MSLVTGDNGLAFATSINNSGLTSGTLQAQGIIRGLATSIDKMDVFGGLAIGATYAFTRIATSAYKMSRDYETAMREVATISDATQADFQGMSDAIMNVGLEVPQSANELAKAFYQIASAGYDGAAGISLLETSAKAAIGGVTDVETAADGLTTIMNAWKIGAEGAEAITDKLFKTVKLGKTTFPELSASISDVAAIAASASIPLEEILAATASLTKQGVPTSQAFTQIKSAIISANDVLGDGWTKTQTFQEGMQGIADKANGSQTELKNLVGRVEAMNAVLGLTGANAAMAASDLDGLRDSAGAAGGAFDEMIVTAENQSKLLAANIEAALKPLGDFILNNVKDITVFLNDAFKSGDVEKFAKIVGIAVTALIAYKGAAALSSISIMDLRRALVSARKAMQLLNIATKTSPIGLIAGILATVAASYLLFKKNTEEAAKAQRTFGDTIAEGTADATQLFEQLKKTNPGTKLRAELIKKINSQYRSYLPHLLTEKSSLDDIRKAQDAVNKSLINSIALKSQNEEISKIQQAQIKREQDAFKQISTSTKVEIGTISAAYQDLMDKSVDGFGTLGDMTSFFAVHDKFKNAASDENRIITQLTNSRKKDATQIQSIVDLYSIYLQKVVDPEAGGNVNEGLKEKLTYYDELKKKLDEQLKAREALSAEESKIDTTKVEQINSEIKATESLISQQELILGITEKEKKAKKEEREAVEGSIQYYEKLLSIAQDNYKYAASDEDRKTYADEIDLLEKKLSAIEGIKIEQTEINQLSYKHLLLMRDAINEELKGIDKASDEYKKYAKLKLDVEKKIGQLTGEWLMDLGQSLGQMADSIGNVNKELGETIQQIASVANDIGGIVEGISKGGPGGYLQASVAAVHLITSLFNGEKRRQKVQERTTETIDEQNRRLEYQLKLLEKVKGVDIYKSFKDSFAEIDRSLTEIQAKYGETETNFWGKTTAKYDASELSKQYDDLLSKREELQDQLYSTLTDTTSNSITDSILQGFQNGQFAAADFADTFEELMKGAILKSFSIKYLEKQFDNFYVAFGKASQSGGGLTQEEINTLRDQFNANISQAQEGFDQFNSLFEDTFGSSLTGNTDRSQGLAGEIKASLTEETGSILAGTLNSIRIYVAEQNDTLVKMYQVLFQIQSNTSYNRELNRLANIEDLLKSQNESLRSIGA